MSSMHCRWKSCSWDRYSCPQCTCFHWRCILDSNSRSRQSRGHNPYKGDWPSRTSHLCLDSIDLNTSCMSHRVWNFYSSCPWQTSHRSLCWCWLRSRGSSSSKHRWPCWTLCRGGSVFCMCWWQNYSKTLGSSLCMSPPWMTCSWCPAVDPECTCPAGQYSQNSRKYSRLDYCSPCIED